MRMYIWLWYRDLASLLSLKDFEKISHNHSNIGILANFAVLYGTVQLIY